MKQDHLLHDGDYRLIIREDRSACIDPPETSLLEDSRLTILLSGADALSIGLRRLEPVVQDSRTLVYVEALSSIVGTVEFTVHQGHEAAGVHPLPVARRKLAHDEELEELEACWATLRLPVPGALKRDVVGASSLADVGHGDAKQWATAYWRALKPLRGQARAIRRHPRLAAETRDTVVNVNEGRRSPITALRAAQQGRQVIAAPAGRWGTDSAAKSMAQHSAHSVQRVVRELLDDLKAAALLSPDLERDLRALGSDLRALTPTSKRPKTRQAVLHDPRYRGLHRAARIARRGRSARDGRVVSQRPPTSDLYEAWCAKALVEDLAAPPARASSLHQLFSRKGHPVEIAADAGVVTISIQYEMKPSSVDRIRHPPPRPDFVIEIQEEDRAFIFDAKYRAAGERLDQPPMDAVDDLHAYRDLFLLHRDIAHKEVWCAVLHPGPGITQTEWTPERFLETAIRRDARIGAIPVRPFLREPLRDYLVRVGLASPDRLSGLDLLY